MPFSAVKHKNILYTRQYTIPGAKIKLVPNHKTSNLQSNQTSPVA